MPIYEYICEDCQTHFEKIVLEQDPGNCRPKCAGEEERHSALRFQFGELR